MSHFFLIYTQFLRKTKKKIKKKCKIYRMLLIEIRFTFLLSAFTTTTGTTQFFLGNRC